jgi:hypothetical protein
MIPFIIFQSSLSGNLNLVKKNEALHAHLEDLLKILNLKENAISKLMERLK